MIEVRAVKGETGQLLQNLLIERGLEVGSRNPEAIVSYGVPLTSSLPCLNANAGKRNKYQELVTLRAAGILVPNHSLDGTGLSFPVLGRKFKHTRAKDIVPILSADQEFEWRKRAQLTDFYTQYIPRECEFRVWAYRRRVKAVYAKEMAHIERYRGLGANWHNGCAFNIISGADEALRNLGAAAVDALGLDFGAADILKGQDGRLYVLEVNTAPGVEGPRQGLSGIADSVVKWARNGFPRRNGDVSSGGRQVRT